jgi:diguanylate cyclase (GGDEF)-like protein
VKRLFAAAAMAGFLSLLWLRLPRWLAAGLIGFGGAGVSVAATCAMLWLGGSRGLTGEPLLLAALLPTLVAMPLSLAVVWAIGRLDGARADAERLTSARPTAAVLSRPDFLRAAAGHLDSARAPTSLCLIAIDDLLRLAESRGHPAGAALRDAVACACKAALRPADLLTHWQGEQFAALLAGVDAHEAVAVAQRLHTMVQAVRLPYPNQGLRASASIGVACAAGSAPTLDALVAQAAGALHAAQQHGRGGIRLVLPGAGIAAAGTRVNAGPGKAATPSITSSG